MFLYQMPSIWHISWRWFVCVCVLDSMWPATWLDRNQVCLAENQPKPTQKKKKKKKQQQLRAQLDRLHSEAASTRAKGIIIHVPILITINFFPFYDQFDSHQYQDWYNFMTSKSPWPLTNKLCTKIAHTQHPSNFNKSKSNKLNRTIIPIFKENPNHPIFSNISIIKQPEFIN